MPKLLPIAKVFISSTFADMQAERDILSRRIMPPLRERMLKRGIDVREIDLRWGVTETMARDCGAVGVCLDGVQECRPLFVGMLGHRYGWVPGDDVIERFGGSRQLPHKSQCSLTELEMRVALQVDQHEGGPSIPLMLRSERLSEELGFIDADPDARAAIAELRGDLAQHPGVNAMAYDTLDEFEARLGEALASVLDAIAPEQIGRENLQPKASAVARPDITHALDKYVHTGRPMLVYGGPGSGKSTVLDLWGDDYSEILRFNGRRSSLSEIVESLVFASGETGIEGIGLHHAADALEALGKREGKRAIIIDHIEASGLTEDHVELSWLPSRISKSLALVVATSNERLLEQAEELGWDIIEMPALDARQVEAIGLRYLRDYGKYLDDNQKQTMLTAPWTGDLSAMLLVLAELRRFGSFETLDERLNALAGITDPVGLIEEIVLGLEASLPAPWDQSVRALIVAVAVSWRGLSADEICKFAGEFAGGEAGDELPLSLFTAIRVTLGSVLIERGNRIDLHQGAAEYWVDMVLGENEGMGTRVADALERSFLRFSPRRAAEEYPRLALFREGRPGLVRMLQQPSMVAELIASEPSALLPLLETFDENELAALEAGWDDPSIDPAERQMLKDHLESLVAGDDEVFDSQSNPSPQEIVDALDAAKCGDAKVAPILIQAANAASLGHIEVTKEMADAIVAGLEALRANRHAALSHTIISRSLLAEGTLLRIRGHSKPALKRLSEAENHARREGLALPLCRSLCEQARAALDLSKFRLAREKSRAALKLARDAHIGRMEALAMDSLIETEHRRANYEEAYNLAREYLERADQGFVSPFRARRALDRLEAG